MEPLADTIQFTRDLIKQTYHSNKFMDLKLYFLWKIIIFLDWKRFLFENCPNYQFDEHFSLKMRQWQTRIARNWNWIHMNVCGGVVCVCVFACGNDSFDDNSQLTAFSRAIATCFLCVTRSCTLNTKTTVVTSENSIQKVYWKHSNLPKCMDQPYL